MLAGQIDHLRGPAESTASHGAICGHRPKRTSAVDPRPNRRARAVLGTGRLRCWGLNADGRLGYGKTADVGEANLPESAGDVSVGGEVIQVSAGRQHPCALLAMGLVRCWGEGCAGILGYGNWEYIGDDELPSSVDDVPLQ